MSDVRIHWITVLAALTGLLLTQGCGKEPAKTDTAPPSTPQKAETPPPAAPAPPPAPTTSAPAAPQAETPAPVAKPDSSAAASSPAAGGAASSGEGTYKKVCATCHDAGIAAAPKVGDKAAWSARMKEGTSTLYGNAIKGKGAHPPKGGSSTLSDDEVKAAVDYMISKSK